MPTRMCMPRCSTDKIAEQQTLTFSLDNDTQKTYGAKRTPFSGNTFR
jgi:hypothetical protein